MNYDKPCGMLSLLFLQALPFGNRGCLSLLRPTHTGSLLTRPATSRRVKLKRKFHDTNTSASSRDAVTHNAWL